MSRGEEADEPVTGADDAAPEEPISPHYEVVVSGDGSAAIDGEPVLLEEGATLDTAILDTLHGHARDRGTAVTADISDPSAGYVACVEVAPDGSSRLLEEHREDPLHREQPQQEAGPPGTDDAHGSADEPAYGPAGEPANELAGEPAGLPAYGPHVGPGDQPDDRTYALPEPAGSPLMPRPAPEPGPDPALDPGPPVRIGRKNSPRQSDDEFESPGLLHRPMVVGPVALGVATLVILPLVMLGSGGSGGGHEAGTAHATGAPGPSASSGTGKPVPTLSIPPGLTASPSASATKPKTPPSGKGDGGATVTETATPPPAAVPQKPPQDTAATAVKRLAESDPSGRHICYRAYVSGQGWQKPVCDGKVAGTTGQDKPIKALNIAVTGVGGSSANAFRHDPESTDGEGKWVKQWTAVVADGKDNYIGSTKKSAPYMTGFGINVGSGQVCRTTRVRDNGWGDQNCAGARPDFLFGGTLENTRWLEAVKFTL